MSIMKSLAQELSPDQKTELLELLKEESYKAELASLDSQLEAAGGDIVLRIAIKQQHAKIKQQMAKISK